MSSRPHFSLPLTNLRDVVDVISAPFLIGFDELIEVAFVPVGEALSQQLLFLFRFLFVETFRFVYLPLLFFLLLRRLR